MYTLNIPLKSFFLRQCTISYSMKGGKKKGRSHKQHHPKTKSDHHPKGKAHVPKSQLKQHGVNSPSTRGYFYSSNHGSKGKGNQFQDSCTAVETAYTHFRSDDDDDFEDILTLDCGQTDGFDCSPDANMNPIDWIAGVSPGKECEHGETWPNCAQNSDKDCELGEIKNCEVVGTSVNCDIKTLFHKSCRGNAAKFRIHALCC